jgi:hypothetical protein
MFQAVIIGVAVVLAGTIPRNTWASAPRVRPVA